MDLTKYDIIDLDSYGIPYLQLELCLQKVKPGTLIFITFIQSIFGRLNKYLLQKLGYTLKMINKAPAMFNRNGFDKFKQYLALKGITNIIHRSTERKHYILIVK